MNFPNWSTSRTQNPKQTTGYPISTCLDRRTQVQTTFARHNVCRESLSHPTILTFVALPHHISFRSHPLDILWYPDWVLQLNPPPFGEGFLDIARHGSLLEASQELEGG